MDASSSEDQPHALSAPVNGQPVEQMDGTHMPVEQPSYDPPAMAAAEGIVPSPIAPPAELVVAAAPQPVPTQGPAQAQAEAEPPPPVVIPTISADTPPEKPKRGWWRR